MGRPRASFRQSNLSFGMHLVVQTALNGDSTSIMTVLELVEPSESSVCSEIEHPQSLFLSSNGTRYTTSTLTDPELLLPHQEDWQALSQRSADSNVFYEPWFFLPAVRHLGRNISWQILIVHRSGPKKNAATELCGFFPFLRCTGPGGIAQLSLWKNQFCFLTNPLVDHHRTGDVLRAVLQHIRQTDPRTACLNLPLIAGEGRFHQRMTEVLREQLSTTFIPDQYLRATSHCSGDATDYFKAALGGHHVREYRRQRRKLEANGQLEYRQLQDLRAMDCWVNWFLDLEAQGWKARAGTAIQLNPDETAFFREMIAHGLPDGKIHMDGLFLNGEPIAMKCNLLSPPVAFAFKIAFDETYRKCSPGVQLELESLQRFANDENLQWIDSCAVPGHQMIDRLWTERRVVRQLMISTGRCRGDLVLGSLPLMRSLNRVRKRCIENFKHKLTRPQQSQKS